MGEECGLHLKHSDPESELGAKPEMLRQVLEGLPLLVVLLRVGVHPRVHLLFRLQFCNIVA